MYVSHTFPSKKIYLFVRECGVSVNIATCTTLCVFEINMPRRLHRRNHERTKKYKESQKDSYIILFISR